MSIQVPQFLIGSLFLIYITACLAGADAKPSHFPETNQIGGEPEANNLLDLSLKPYQIEMLAQRLYEYYNQQQQQQQPLTGNDLAWERTLRSPENKRQSRYRQCYFNPISCFRK